MFGKFFVVLSLLALAYGDERFNFLFFTGPTMGDTTSFSFDNFQTILNHPAFVRTRGTILIHHTTGQTITTSQVFDLIQSYFNRGTYNLVVVTYGNSLDINTDNANVLAQALAIANINLFDNGYNSGLMNFVGFRLGAQILARASRQIQGQTNRRHIVGRLTGLEPENLGPINGITIGRLSSADAQFVESVHTDGNGQRGDLESNGHVAFFVNGGVNQPQCTQANPAARWDCNTLFALTYWSEAARSAVPIFPSLLCPSYSEFLAGICNSQPQANMGRATEFNNRGNYYLQTNLTPPWSRNTALPIGA